MDARARGARSHGWVASRDLVSQLGAVGAPLRNLQLLSGWGWLGGDGLGHRSLAEVAAAHQPLIVLLDQQAAGQADEGLVLGEHPHHVGAPPGLPVDPL
jgi:hypothetical protein